jgi:hypothetical protein
MASVVAKSTLLALIVIDQTAKEVFAFFGCDDEATAVVALAVDCFEAPDLFRLSAL